MYFPVISSMFLQMDTVVNYASKVFSTTQISLKYAA